MKVYVSEMPKSCEECPFCEYFKKDAHGKGKNEVACYLCGFIENVFVGDKLNAKNCKYLQSLTDYTKQVRKEVCEEIRDFAGDYWTIPLNKYVDYDRNEIKAFLTMKDFDEILDQIQGE